MNLRGGESEAAQYYPNEKEERHASENFVGKVFSHAQVTSQCQGQ